LVKDGQRKWCKMCRWKLCLEVGMSRDNIQMGRIPNRVKLKKANNQIAIAKSIKNRKHFEKNRK
jgi:hypothetical protein